MIKTFSALAIGAILTVSSAHASVFSVNFSGTVYQTQGATGYANGGAISGHFDLDSASGNFLDFTIGGKSVAAGFQSSAVIDPGGFDAIYKAQISPVSVGGTSNNTFSLDLSSLTNWPAYDSAYSLLVDSKQLPSNLDTASNPQSAFPSTFSYYTANANGTGTVSLSADLTTLSATAPEPGTFALLASSLVGLGLLIRRRRS